jgi:hypothetical protein
MTSWEKDSAPGRLQAHTGNKERVEDQLHVYPLQDYIAVVWIGFISLPLLLWWVGKSEWVRVIIFIAELVIADSTIEFLSSILQSECRDEKMFRSSSCIIWVRVVSRKYFRIHMNALKRQSSVSAVWRSHEFFFMMKRCLLSISFYTRCGFDFIVDRPVSLDSLAW